VLPQSGVAEPTGPAASLWVLGGLMLVGGLGLLGFSRLRRTA